VSFWSSDATLNDKVFSYALLAATILPVAGPIMATELADPTYDPFGYEPTAVFAVMRTLVWFVLGGYFVVTLTYNFVNNRTLVQNAAVYRQKAGAIGGRFYWRFLPRLVANRVGGALFLLLGCSLYVLFAWMFAWWALPSILVIFDLRSLVTGA
jgi:hypothetical protein